jgi:hypothetical protein
MKGYAVKILMRALHLDVLALIRKQQCERYTSEKIAPCPIQMFRVVCKTYANVSS